MDKVLAEMNYATAAHLNASEPMPQSEVEQYMAAWGQCGGFNPYDPATTGDGGRRRLGSAQCSRYACYRNRLTNGNVFCNIVCGLFSYCNARMSQWGTCRYAG